MNWLNLVKFKMLCERNGIEVPRVITQAIELIDAADAFNREPEVRVLDLSAEQVGAYVADFSVRQHVTRGDKLTGLHPGIERIRDQVWGEVREVITPDLDDIVAALRPRFDAVVAPIVEGAQQHGFTYATTSDDVVRSGSVEAFKLWGSVGGSWPAVRPFAQLRTSISTLFEVSPTRGESKAFGVLDDGARNWSVCFAAGEDWSMRDGYHVEDRPSVAGLDWFAIARGGLRLNTPTEVREKIVQRAERTGTTLEPEVDDGGIADEAWRPLDGLGPTYPTRD